MRRACTLIALAALASCGEKTPERQRDVTAYDIDRGRITVSGLSSGAYMAGQLHVAHAGLFSGAGLISGGPYWCAQASVTQALEACVSGQGLEIGPLAEHARELERQGNVESLVSLQGDKVWLFHGANDEIVNVAVTQAARALYEDFGADVTFVSDVAAVHGMPTLENGAPCDQMLTPFINACDYDAAGEMLATLYNGLQPRAVASGELLAVPQPGADSADMLSDAFLYVPSSCANGEACGLHVSFHGCRQSSAYVGDAFAAGAGYNEWAETNHLLILYPQVASSRIAPMNPLGCWDWWGYTDDDYATRNGQQVAVVKATMDILAGREL